MNGNRTKIRCLLSYLTAALFLAGGCVFFHELFLGAERHSFFAFQQDFLSGFMPWNAQHNMYPGERHGFADLLAVFSAQFFRTPWSTAAFMVGGGLLFCFLMTLLCRRLIAFARKKTVLFFLPLFWAILFLLVQVCLALRIEPDYPGLAYHGKDRILRKTERLLFEGDYQQALQTANDYWFSHPCPINDVVTGQNSLYASLSEEEILFRLDLAAYTRVALIGTKRLNEDFFHYFRVPEIYNNLENSGARVGYRCDALRGQITGNHTFSYSQAMNVMETEGLSASMLGKSIFSALVCHQYALANKYIRLLKSSLFYRREARLYESVLPVLQDTSAVPANLCPQQADLMARIKEERIKAPKDYIHDIESTNEARQLWSQSPFSAENLERIALIDLLYKDTEAFLKHLPDYVRLNVQKPPYRFPSSWQEMIYALMQDRPETLNPVRPYIENMAWNNEILKQCGLFYKAKDALHRRAISPQQITQNFGHTFLYNYHFSRFVDMAQTNKPLAH